MVHHSTAIEGNTLNEYEIKRIFEGKQIDAVPREVFEVKNYKKALDWIRKKQTAKITKKDILESYLDDKDITFYTNSDFNKTNMVATLFCAQEFMDDDLIISYADIVYEKEVLAKLVDSHDDFSVVVDRKWRELWSLRMENPLSDAETLKIKDGNIIELGKPPHGYEDIEGQYVGLVKISKNVISQVIDFYNELDKGKEYDGKDFDNMYMTSFIQMIIDKLTDVKPIFIDGGWVEIDCLEDMKSVFIR